MANPHDVTILHRPWNKGHFVGQKPQLKLKEIWSIRIRLQIANKVHHLVPITPDVRQTNGGE